MWRWNALRIVLFAVILAAPLPVFAQPATRTAEARLPADAVEAEQLGQLFWRTDFVRFEIILGRITARNACHGKARIATMGDLDQGAGETLTLRVLEGAPRIRYELVRDGETFTLSANDVDRLHFEKRTADGALHIRFDQQPGEDVRLIVRDKGRETILHAPSVWHLWLRDSQTCSRYLQPCLAVLRPHWQLSKQITELEEQLFAFRGPYFLPDRDSPFEVNYETWLKQMSDDRYAVRQAAYVRFLQAGIAAKPFLDHLDLRRLDGEQRMRVRKLRKSMVFRSEDTVSRVASWLRDDRWVWFAYLNDRHPSKRRLAYSHLKRICGDSLRYDPEAEADLRESQLTVLQQRVFP